MKNRAMDKTQLNSVLVETPIGEMIAIARNDALLFLKFTDSPKFEDEITQLCRRQNAVIKETLTPLLTSIENEVTNYFKGKLCSFTIPLCSYGTEFQQYTWQSISRIPFATTTNYAEQAITIGRKTAFRAVANANRANPIAIIIPCHRIVRSNGDLGGYRGGLDRKKWLLNHEKIVNFTF